MRSGIRQQMNGVRFPRNSSGIPAFVVKHNWVRGTAPKNKQPACDGASIRDHRDIRELRLPVLYSCAHRRIVSD